MFFRQKFVEFGQLVILVGLPMACEFEDGEKPFGVLPEMLGEVFDKNVGAQPIKIAGVLGAEQVVAAGASGSEIGQRIGRNFGGFSVGRFIRAEQCAIAVMVLGAGVEERGI